MASITASTHRQAAAITVQLVCTLVCRWDPGDDYPVQLLALRDERRSRAFDEPGAWWPQAPGVIGGRDRLAGGSWCVSDPVSAATAVVLNRSERRIAAPGAPSRGVLPLLAATYGPSWPEHLPLAGMASFNLVLARPDQLQHWSFDGTALTSETLGAGTHLFKPAGRVLDGIDPHLLDGRTQLHDATTPTDLAWGEWFTALAGSAPQPDGSGLLTRLPLEDGDTYETVFAEFIAGAPGSLRIDYLTDPISGGEWTTQRHRVGTVQG